MKALIQWFQSHRLSTHTLASAAIAGDALWYTNADFKNFVWGIYIALPRSVHGVIVGLVIPAFLYWKMKKDPAQGKPAAA